MSRLPHPHSTVCPDLGTMEGDERFHHRDLAKNDDPLLLWGEELVIRNRLAQLVYGRSKGQLIQVADDLLIHERQWYQERLTKLHLARRRASGVAA